MEYISEKERERERERERESSVEQIFTNIKLKKVMLFYITTLVTGYSNDKLITASEF